MNAPTQPSVTRKRWAWRGWSYRTKVPLFIILVSMITALSMSVVIAVSARHWLTEDLREHASAVAQSMARGLALHIVRDDVWEAFEAVRSVASVEGGAERSRVVVLDRSDRVFVSSDPTVFPTNSTVAGLSAPLMHAFGLNAEQTGPALDDIAVGGQSYSVVKLPLVSSDGEMIGTLLMSYSHAVFAARYADTVKTVAWISAGFAALLLPLGWWLGHRLAAPVARATDTLYKLANDAAAKSSAFAAVATQTPATTPQPASELDRLEHSVERLAAQLQEKEQLQHQFLAADRLAAIGRLTSGVAHEINNPLAGMLNALSNLRRDPTLVNKTVALLERGLDQIRHTLSALLIETKTTARPLSPADVEDVRVLVVPQAAHKQLQVFWSYPIEGELDVAAAPVRQVLLNLLLNAVSAAQRFVGFEARVDGAWLIFRVVNDGQEFPVARRDHPFEPGSNGAGHGLGLWASHQLVASMGGAIELTTADGETSFEVRVPLHPLVAAQSAEKASSTQVA